MNSNYCLLFLCSVFLFTISSATETSKGFTIDLIHRDSLQSPSSKTRWTRLTDAIRRSTARVDRFKLKVSQTDVQSSLVPAGGEYLMNLSIGTPPVPILGIADTGSDLIWTQCKPCVECYNQKPPIFDPRRSSSYRNLSCQSNACHTIPSTACDMGTCSYSYSYGDQSHTAGDLAADTLSFGGEATFSNVVIGCGHDNGGTFNENGSGLIGLGGGSLSLVSQLSQPLGSRFAYCFTPLDDNSSKSSKISFGDKAVVSGGPGVVSTPLVAKDPATFYYLTLQGIGVGDHILEYKSTPFNSREYYNIGVNEGNIIIDSGTTLTFLPEEFYSELEAAVEAAVEGGERADDPEGVLSLCYRSKGELKVPGIRVRFEGGEVEVKASNAFVRMEEDLVCLGAKGASDVAIFGNLWQMDLLVGYDLREGKVTFKPVDCSEHV